MHRSIEDGLSKTPHVTLLFWIIKIAATTLGKTAGDALSMSLNCGYAASSFVLFGIFLALCVAQIRAERYRPFLYWAVVIATTTVGTTIADFADRSLGWGYLGGVAVLASFLAVVLFVWRRTLGTISVARIVDRKAEGFYWLAILASNMLGTALSDYFADGSGLGYDGAALIFISALAIIVALMLATDMSVTLLFWAAFVLTRPLGAALGDLLTKPLDHGGLDLSRFSSSGVLAALILALVLFGTRSGGSPHADARSSV
ncbi:COG4705 family protein [Chenggangzhangella methanolivorans]|uniref:Membrane-anchored protein n=1 Tax=Chenggangzhangella methanolivorans TaxID=1437009 RepID=A0A9E6ULE8_9HYPH|nr:hypothetical protein [Chenggangzhangella methanolivorans]QZN98860.1 hypothetical protein K6K41_18305 [Chenggangzhangella methanolivorans]